MTKLYIATLLAGTAITSFAYAQQNGADNATAMQTAQAQQNQGLNDQADVVVDPNAPEVRVNVPEPNVTVTRRSRMSP